MGENLRIMANEIYESESAQVKYWWLSVLVGIASLVVGFLVLVNPIESYFVMAMWLGIVILFTGVFSLVEAFTSHSRYVRRGWLVLASICDIIIGIVLMLNFLLSVAIIPVLFGIWLLYRGFVTLAQGITLRSSGVRDAGWVIFSSVVVIAISLAVLFVPEIIGVAAVVIFVAIALMAYGISRISLGFRLATVDEK
jgi:uncharacterized membrane protein HdeD (DUF308 family)